MAKHFDLRKQLKLHDKVLLRRLFAEHGQLRDFPWEDVAPHNVDPLVERWEKIDEPTRRQLQVVLQDVNELADPSGQKILTEHLEWRFPETLDHFRQWPSLLDKALWAYLEVRPVFDEAAIFARAVALRNGQFANRWNHLPQRTVHVTSEHLVALENEIRSFYWRTELRGEMCRIHHYSHPDGSEIFYAYLLDWPDKRLVFDAEGNLTPREEAYTFSNVFLFDSSAGALELIAKGGLKVHYALRRAFCKTILGVEVDDEEPLRPSYQLDHLLDPSFTFVTEPEDRIAAVRLRRIRLVPMVSVPAVEYIEPKLLETASHGEVMGALYRLLDAMGLDRTQVSVAQVSIQLVFLGDGSRKGKSMTFRVSCPASCDLKSKPDDVRVVGERCMKRWGMVP